MLRRVKLSRQQRHIQDGVIAFNAGPGSSRMRIFVTRRKEIKAAQQMNARYWNKKAQKFGNYWMFGAGSKSRKQNAH